MAERILIVEDEARVVRLVREVLKAVGYEVTATASGEAAIERVALEAPDLVLLDLMLPEGPDGYEVCRRLREFSEVPVIMLTARAQDTDVLRGFEVGADDYLTKPFNAKELVARVKAVLRRSEVSAYDDMQSRVAAGDLRLDPVGSKVVRSDGSEIELTPIEFRLLHVLMRNAGRVLSHDYLLANAWGYEYEGYSNQIAVYIRRLRTKIEPKPSNPCYLHTVRGVGYKFEKH